MKKVILAVAALFVALSGSAQAAGDNKPRFAGNSYYVSFCKAAVNNSITLFNHGLRKGVGVLGATKKDVFMHVLSGDNFKCSGMGIQDFARQRNATKLVAFLEKKANQYNDGKVMYTGDRSFANFCKAAVADDVNLFQRAVLSQVGRLAENEEQVLKKILSAKSIQCSGLDLKDFSKQRKANKLMAYMAGNAA